MCGLCPGAPTSVRRQYPLTLSLSTQFCRATRLSPPSPPVLSALGSPPPAASRSALPIADSQARFPRALGASYPPSVSDRSASIKSSFPLSFHAPPVQLHSRLRNANVLFRQLRASFHDSVQENKHRSWVSEAECGISARLARFYEGFRIGVTGRPVFWRKGHVPKNGIGQHELHAHLRMTALMPVNVCDDTLQ
ncbi:MAG: hypothetical protein JWN63_1996 [Candidatus Acidoferrum typicum]|nr:hypothetical protein [Candidatus Acidoferrum typicum]